MAVDYVGHPNVFAEFDGRSAKFRKAFGVVRIIPPRHAIQLLAIEIFWIIHEIIVDPVQRSTLLDGRKSQAFSRRDRQAVHGHRKRARIAVTRKQHGHFMAERGQRFWQRFDHVRQAARLREWKPFRCDKKYFHGEFEASNVLKRSSAVKDGCRQYLGRLRLNRSLVARASACGGSS
jgi:hypothetical protein